MQSIARYRGHVTACVGDFSGGRTLPRAGRDLAARSPRRCRGYLSESDLGAL